MAPFLSRAYLFEGQVSCRLGLLAMSSEQRCCCCCCRCFTYQPTRSLLLDGWKLIQAACYRWSKFGKGATCEAQSELDCSRAFLFLRQSINQLGQPTKGMTKRGSNLNFKSDQYERLESAKRLKKPKKADLI